MKTHRSAIVCVLALGLSAMVVSSAAAATMFTEDFSDLAPGPHLNDAGPIHIQSGTPSTSITYTGGNAVWDAGQNYRRYIGTNDADYYGVDFVYQATVTQLGNGAGWDIAFFGMGNTNTQPAGSGEPAGPNAQVQLWPAITINNAVDQVRKKLYSTDANFVPGNVPAAGTHTYRMTWDATNQHALFEIDADSSTFVNADYHIEVDASNSLLNNTNSQLIFGGGNGQAWDDVSVQAKPPTPLSEVNLALSKPVVYTSSAHPVGAPGQNVTDGSMGGESFTESYWLAADNVVAGAAEAYFILDLQEAALIDAIELYNTHNSGYGDRGTTSFRIEASNTWNGVDNLTGATNILSGTLTDTVGQISPPPDVFNSGNGLTTGAYRYLKFVAIDAKNDDAGLNEIRVLSTATPTGNYADLVLQRNPRAYWRLGEAAGPTAVDTANAPGPPQDGSQDGTYVGGPTLGVPGAIDGDADTAVQFDGIDDRVQIADPVHPTAYTLEAWVNPSAIQGQNIIVRTAADPTTTWSHQVRMTADGRFEAYTYHGAVASVIGDTVASAGQWYHIVATAENGGSMRLFVNGAEEGTAAPITNLWTGGAEWQIGAATGNSMGFFNGAIDEVALYANVLSPTSIAQNYALGVPEPSSVVLILCGLLAALSCRRRS